MQFSNIIAAAALAGYTLAHGANVTVTTNIVVTDFTTWCPEPTHFIVNNKTVTVTEATTLTITGPCTIPTTYVSEVTTPGAAAPPVTSKTTVAGESTHPAAVSPASSSHETTSTIAVVSTVVNGAEKAVVGAAAGLAAVFAALV